MIINTLQTVTKKQKQGDTVNEKAELVNEVVNGP